jgi:F-type H+-transporting ATPase subunit b
MIAAVAAVSSTGVVTVRLTAEGSSTISRQASTETTTTAPEDPSPLKPEIKEIAWGAGSFLVLLVLMRFFLYPRVANGMAARQAHVAADLAEANALTTGAQAEVAEYEAALATVRQEAAAKVDAVRQQLETERTAALATANALINERKAAAQAESDAAKAAAHDAVVDAAQQVVTSAARMALGREPDAATVQAAVAQAMSAGASR